MSPYNLDLSIKRPPQLSFLVFYVLFKKRFPPTGKYSIPTSWGTKSNLQRWIKVLLHFNEKFLCAAFNAIKLHLLRGANANTHNAFHLPPGKLDWELYWKAKNLSHYQSAPISSTAWCARTGAWVLLERQTRKVMLRSMEVLLLEIGNEVQDLSQKCRCAELLREWRAANWSLGFLYSDYAIMNDSAGYIFRPLEKSVMSTGDCRRCLKLALFAKP